MRGPLATGPWPAHCEKKIIHLVDPWPPRPPSHAGLGTLREEVDRGPVAAQALVLVVVVEAAAVEELELTGGPEGGRGDRERGHVPEVLPAPDAPDLQNVPPRRHEEPLCRRRLQLPPVLLQRVARVDVFDSFLYLVISSSSMVSRNQPLSCPSSETSKRRMPRG